MKHSRPRQHMRTCKSGKKILVNKGVKPRRELIRGGFGDGMPDCMFDKNQLAKGVRVELEHTNNPKIAREIAKDHLTEFTDYYKELAKMENKLESKKKKKSKRSMRISKLTPDEEEYIINTYGLEPEDLPDYEVQEAISDRRDLHSRSKRSRSNYNWAGDYNTKKKNESPWTNDNTLVKREK